MREILFRGKTPDGRWVYGDLVKDPCEIHGEKYTEYIIRGYGEFTVNGNEFFELVTAKTVGQYTGLKDKTGEMIFEGDLIRTTNNGFNISKQEMRGIVEYVNCVFVGNRKNMAQDISLRSSDLEIIGNIHDNPELLK